MSSHSSSRAASADEEQRVVERVLAGEVEAFEQIVSRWQGPLLSLAYRLSRDRGLAEDMAQGAFLKIYRNLGKWRGDSKFSTWLFSVALNHYRSTLRRHVPPKVELSELDAASQAGDLAGEMDAAANDAVVRRAVTLLPPKYRDAIAVFYFQEQDLAETAATMGLPPGTVKARLHRGRKLLEDKLRALGHPVAAASQETAA